MTISPEILAQSLSRWFEEQDFKQVAFREEWNPQGEDWDYKVVYNAYFEPESLEQAYLHVYVTDEGYVGVAFEIRSRIARRLGIRSKSPRCAGGFEPGETSFEDIMLLVKFVAAGEIYVTAKIFPGFGVVDAQAILSSHAYADLKGTSVMCGFRQKPQFDLFRLQRILRYSAWS